VVALGGKDSIFIITDGQDDNFFMSSLGNSYIIFRHFSFFLKKTLFSKS
jgi:hypothetical protein